MSVDPGRSGVAIDAGGYTVRVGAGLRDDLAPLIAKNNYDLTQFAQGAVDFYKIGSQGQVGIPFAIYPSELFPTGVRATANGFATGASRVGAAIGVYGAPHLLAYSVQLTMLVGAGVAGLGWLVTVLLAPETNGKLLTESSAVSQSATIRPVKSTVVADDGRAEAAL